MTITSLFSQSFASLWNRSASDGGAVSLASLRGIADAPPDVRRLIRERRYCRLLAPDAELPFDGSSQGLAWKAIEQEMGMVPAGDVWLASSLAATAGWTLESNANAHQCESVRSLYIDRTTVTNADYARFVSGGGYSNPDFWPEQILPNVLQFVDKTGRPGPRFWSQGQPPSAKLSHPVVGICWYEANAYALWAGKRLPTSAEWQRAGTWPKSGASSTSQQRYPWGNSFDPAKANLRSAGQGDTVPAHAFHAGQTPNGVQQLVGNVWEWVAGPFHLDVNDQVAVVFSEPMGEIRGGAYDTYFHSQATCQFRTGLPLLNRVSNVGFRCCVAEEDLAPPPDSLTHAEEGDDA